MTTNSRFTERNALLAVLNPQSQGAGARSTAWLPFSQWHQVAALIKIGAFGASATVDAKFEQATSSGGAGAKDVTGKSITQLVAAGGNDRQVFIEMRDSDLDTNGGFTHFRLTVTVGTAATLTDAAVFGTLARNHATSQPASVAQVVA